MAAEGICRPGPHSSAERGIDRVCSRAPWSYARSRWPLIPPTSRPASRRSVRARPSRPSSARTRTSAGRCSNERSNPCCTSGSRRSRSSWWPTTTTRWPSGSRPGSRPSCWSATRARRAPRAARTPRLAVARGEIAAFLDDDAAAPPDWVQNFLVHFADPERDRRRHPRVPRVGGRPAPLVQARVRLDRGLQPRRPARDHCARPQRHRLVDGAAADLARRIGGFRTDLGRVGSLPVGCEETEFFIRAPPARSRHRGALRPRHDRAPPRAERALVEALLRAPLLAQGDRRPRSRSSAARATGCPPSARTCGTRSPPRSCTRSSNRALRGRRHRARHRRHDGGLRHRACYVWAGNEHATWRARRLSVAIDGSLARGLPRPLLGLSAHFDGSMLASPPLTRQHDPTLHPSTSRVVRAGGSVSRRRASPRTPLSVGAPFPVTVEPFNRSAPPRQLPRPAGLRNGRHGRIVARRHRR